MYNSAYRLKDGALMSDTGKKALLLSCSDHYGHRIHVIDKCLKEKGYETVYITSDFDHTLKQNFKCDVPGCVQLRSKPYKKNLSFARILSHRNFARDVFRYIEGLDTQPDVISVQLPPNFMGHYAAKYKKKYPDVKIIFDIFDMWPETFPGGSIKKLLAPVFKVWAWVRNHSLCAADFITCECDMFRELLKLDDKKSETIYLCRKPYELKRPAVLEEDKIHLCYLGAINNVISIPDICSLIKEIIKKKPVVLHIIGKGEREQEFVDCAKAAGAEVIFHGAIYDEDKKEEIMSRCHFGLNIMKSSVCVGLTMKSIDYFCFGLPIINNIPADTARLVKERGIGVQLDENCVDKVLSMKSENFLRMRDDVKKVFAHYFEEKIVEDKYISIIDKTI